MSTRLHTAPLQRLPCTLGLAGDAGPGGMDVAERFGLWLGTLDAIGLRAALESLQAPRPARASAGPRSGAPALAEDLQRVQGAARAAIARDVDLDLGREPDGRPGFSPWRQRHLELQRLIAPMVEGLRDHVRQALARSSPRLARLAALDAALAPVVGRREQALWPTLATLLERRFLQLRREADGDAWLDDFGREWRQALTLELELRLAPVAGLVEAFYSQDNDESHKG
ncbi:MULTISPECIES: DUF3348 family protein [Ramlibacter]|uniref:DUF3348 family protein n=1 Tax=Ramlibacter aquaticus TaxID=2780094 RepID=A0ABR9SJ82_9BURK|nr:MULTISPECIES: DUF3348 family protein [Ramlibacter]MBE7942418.1 DUF3348 family protein [Ramlibacter aquaticus]